MGFSTERNVQMLIYLMKQHGIRHVIISPGATNVTFVASIQQDPFFHLYSSVDERSAAYMACGLAFETGEAVALSCTGATASRNYFPGLTEAYYRKLPILAITSTQNEGLIGQGVPQVIDRSQQPKDTVRLSVSIPTIQGQEDERYVALKLNNALLELKRFGGGPVHINLATNYSKDYSIKSILPCRVIHRHEITSDLPLIKEKNVAVCIGAHKKMSDELTKSIERFCECNNAVVLVDHTSSYHGKYGIQANLILDQDCYSPQCTKIDLLIDIGEVTGAYFRLYPKKTWRVSEEGELRDTYRSLTDIFQMSEQQFFAAYGKEPTKKPISYYELWKNEYDILSKQIPNTPFSNVWVAGQLSSRIPTGSMLYLGILNSLRSWNYFRIPESVECFSNTGGFGIDGGLSSIVGAALANPNKLYFAVVGDLGFFYDMNALGNRYVGKNLRILLINNGIGTEFKNYNHNAYIHGDEANKFIAAEGHFGNKSKFLVKHYAEDLGFSYLSASNKEEFQNSFNQFISEDWQEKSVIFEVFTDSSSESDAIKMMRNIRKDSVPKSATIESEIKKSIRSAIGDKRMGALRDLIKG